MGCGRLAFRGALQAIHDSGAKSLRRNSLGDDKIEIEGVELAQITEKICGGFTQVACGT